MQPEAAPAPSDVLHLMDRHSLALCTSDWQLAASIATAPQVEAMIDAVESNPHPLTYQPGRIEREVAVDSVEYDERGFYVAATSRRTGPGSAESAFPVVLELKPVRDGERWLIDGQRIRGTRAPEFD